MVYHEYLLGQVPGFRIASDYHVQGKRQSCIVLNLCLGKTLDTPNKVYLDHCRRKCCILLGQSISGAFWCPAVQMGNNWGQTEGNWSQTFSTFVFSPQEQLPLSRTSPKHVLR